MPPAPTLTPGQIESIARKIAEIVIASQDEMWTLERLHKEKGFSKSFIYHNIDILGGVKNAGKWFFSRRNIETLIRNGKL